MFLATRTRQMANCCSRYCILYFSILFLSIHSSAQKAYTVMDWKTDVTLNTYLIQQMKKQYDNRRLEFDKAITSRQNAEQYVEAVRNKFASLMPELPKKTKLNAKVTGVIRQNNYSIEKIVYESFPGHHVTCNLYLPNGS